MTLQVLQEHFSICKIEDYTKMDFSIPYIFTGSTDEENSLICPEKAVPENVICREDGWRGFRVQGVLDFSLIGVLAKITTALSKSRIGIMAVSTFNTDYIFVRKEDLTLALQVLEREGYDIV